MCLVCASGVGDIFSGLIQMQVGVARQPLRQGVLAGKPMRELPLARHELSVSACRAFQSFIFVQRRQTRLAACPVGQVEQVPLRLLVIN